MKGSQSIERKTVGKVPAPSKSIYRLAVGEKRAGLGSLVPLGVTCQSDTTSRPPFSFSLVEPAAFSLQHGVSAYRGERGIDPCVSACVSRRTCMRGMRVFEFCVAGSVMALAAEW
jgi:hypothetical protein